MSSRSGAGTDSPSGECWLGKVFNLSASLSDHPEDIRLLQTDGLPLGCIPSLFALSPRMYVHDAGNGYIAGKGLNSGKDKPG